MAVSAVLLSIGLIYGLMSTRSTNLSSAAPASKTLGHPSQTAQTTLAAACTTVFISSFCIMALELAASRLTSRYLGSSLYTWTAVIGVVLSGITLGYYIGGRLADFAASAKSVALLFIAASFTCTSCIVLNNVIAEWTWLWQFSWPLRTFTHVTLIFVLPSICLGTISPVIAKRALDLGQASGSTVGKIYAWGAAGSIAGTFAAGFFMIELIGPLKLIWVVATLLLIIALAYQPRSKLSFCWTGTLVLALILGLAPWETAHKAGTALALRAQTPQNIIYENETAYCYVAVKKHSDSPEIRTFIQDKLTHSTVNMENITDLQYPYEQIYAALTSRFSNSKTRLSTLTIGGGGYVFPRYIEKLWPGSRIDVVEIDPGVTKAAQIAFGLSPDSPIRTITMDGRNYVDQLIARGNDSETSIKYDFIYEDAINDYSVPFQIVTQEFNDKIMKILAPEGIYMINLIDCLESSLFLGAIANTIQKTFPHVYIITDNRENTAVRNTFIIAASRRSLDLNNIGHTYRAGFDLWVLNSDEVTGLIAKSGNIILTDNYAPVENLLAPVVNKNLDQAISMRKISESQNIAQQMQDLAWQGELAAAFAKLDVVVANDPAVSVRAYNVLASIMNAQNKPEQVAEVYQRSLQYHSQNRPEVFTGEILYNYADVMGKLGRKVEKNALLVLSRKSYLEKTAKNPAYTKGHLHLGAIAFQLGKLDTAEKHLQKAVALRPDSLLNNKFLIRILAQSGKAEEAYAIAEKALSLFEQYDRQKEFTQLQEYMNKMQLVKKNS
ncbi:MAG: hypothetical protein GY850_12925 [bacterium]|nr:hypothetical protein [bacterium]